MALAFLLCASSANAQSAPAEDRRAAEAAMHAMAHEHDAMADRHLLLSTPRSATPADSARAAQLVAVIRRDLARYKDVEVARKEGFQQFRPEIPQPIYHFVNYLSGVLEAFAFDPARPTALLYRKESDGRFTLTGVMYTAPRILEESVLDERIPLSIARWHQHINWCMPRRGEQRRWAETRDGQPLFGPESPIATREACIETGGRFVPRLFGWMVHVNAFESDDPRAIWGEHHGR